MAENCKVGIRLGSKDQFEIGEAVICPFDGVYYNAVVLEPEVYWADRGERTGDVRVMLDTGQKLWCKPQELIKRSE